MSSILVFSRTAAANVTAHTLKDVGIVAGVGIVAPSAMIVGAIGTGGGILNSNRPRHQPRMANSDNRQHQQSDDGDCANGETQTALRRIRHIAC